MYCKLLTYQLSANRLALAVVTKCVDLYHLLLKLYRSVFRDATGIQTGTAHIRSRVLIEP